MSTSHNSPKQDTYRVSLTTEQILNILSLAKSSYAASANQSALDIIAKLSIYQTKIENKALAPAYTLAPAKPTLEQSLGMEPLPASFPKEVYWKQCYDSYLAASKDWSKLSIAEIEAAREHMYLNDLMTPAEIAEFEGTTDSATPTPYNSPETTAQ